MTNRQTVPAAAVVLRDRAVAVLVTFAAVWGSLVGSLSTGIRRTPARASAPAARSNPRERVAGPTVRPSNVVRPFNAGAGGPGFLSPFPGVPAALPVRAGQGGPKLTTAAGVIPGHLAAVVDQTAGVS